MTRRSCFAGLVCTTFLLALLSAGAGAPLPAARIFPEKSGDPDEYKIISGAKDLQSLHLLLDIPAVEAQLKRSSCKLKLAPPRTKELTGRQLWGMAQAAHLRVGWYHLCNKCGKWHLNLAGGYAITSDGAVATCDHVIRPAKNEMPQGYLIAATDEGAVYPVTEVLATSRSADVAIIRVMTTGLVPLPLSTNVLPGDSAWCYSEPMTRRGYFSHGIVNRFVRKGPGKPVFFNVGTDWAPGSSGSAVLDSYGNAIGHVSSIEALARNESESQSAAAEMTQIILHEAAASRELLKLIQP